jgi:hypothetical protein
VAQVVERLLSKCEAQEKAGTQWFTVLLPVGRPGAQAVVGFGAVQVWGVVVLAGSWLGQGRCRIQQEQRPQG